ncbi:Dabb family protein [Leifsonia sp. NPDC058230]|uniref:Dabb family protein n=1 Tax=Leifsonia sp. NPDC058230 TaxID=3346391 RepID=UPI0036DC6FE0
MSITHTVVFSLAHQPGSGEEAEFLQTARDTLSAIPGVHEFTVRRQVSTFSSLGFQFSMVFDDHPAYTAYNDHPAHVRFVENRWKPEVTEFQEFDFIEA